MGVCSGNACGLRDVCVCMHVCVFELIYGNAVQSSSEFHILLYYLEYTK